METKPLRLPVYGLTPIRSGLKKLFPEQWFLRSKTQTCCYRFGEINRRIRLDCFLKLKCVYEQII